MSEQKSTCPKAELDLYSGLSIDRKGSSLPPVLLQDFGEHGWGRKGLVKLFFSLCFRFSIHGPKQRKKIILNTSSVFCLFFCFSKATPAAYGSSQARSPIGTTAVSLHRSSWQCRILNPLSKAGDQPPSSWILVRFISTAPQWEFRPPFLLRW